MANSDMPKGFVPKGEPLRQNAYVAAGIIYPGEAVKLSSGKVTQATGSTEALCGVAASYAAADGDAVNVWDHPEQLYIVQADGSAPDAQADVGKNYAVLPTAGNSAYRVARQELESASEAADADKPLLLLGFENRADNAVGSANVDCIVKIARHQLADVEGADNT